MSNTTEEPMGVMGSFPNIRKNATLEELRAAYKAVEADKDMPEALRDQLLSDLSDRIRDHGKPKPEPKPSPGFEEGGVAFNGAPLKAVVESGFRGYVPGEGGRSVKVK